MKKITVFGKAVLAVFAVVSVCLAATVFQLSGFVRRKAFAYGESNRISVSVSGGAAENMDIMSFANNVSSDLYANKPVEAVLLGDCILTDDITMNQHTLTTIRLDLNGYMLKSSANGKRCFRIYHTCTLTLEDSYTGSDRKHTLDSDPTVEITGGLITSDNASESGYGGGIFVYTGTFIMNGGTIAGNKANHGGGVILQVGANFIMNGGAITANFADSGGGVYSLNNTDIFTVNGGTISGNRAFNFGGGVYCTGAFNMKGGTISGNTSYNQGGGVYGYGSFHMHGGLVTGNIAKFGAGGVYSYSTPTFKGDAVVRRNKKEVLTGPQTETDNNVEVYLGRTIIFEDFTGSIGTTINEGDLTITNTWDQSNTGTIVSDKPEYGIKYDFLNSTATLTDSLYEASLAAETVSYGSFAGMWSEAVDYAAAPPGRRARITLYKDISLDSTLQIASRFLNVTLDLNGFKLSGGSQAAVSATGGTFILMDSTGVFGALESSIASPGRCVYVCGGDFIMRSGAIAGDAQTGAGGGVIIDGSGSFTMDGGLITGNTAYSLGGAVYAVGGSFAMNGGLITGNSAVYGGAAYIDDGVFTVSGGEISDNTALYDGGGAYVDGGVFTMSGGLISGNRAAYGGGFYLKDGADTAFSMRGGTVTGNFALNCGGGAFIGRSVFDMSGGEIIDNTADSNQPLNGGGGAYISSGVLNMSGGKIAGNTANSYGGGVLAAHNPSEPVPESMNLSGGLITGNTAVLGGGVHILIGKLTVSGGTVTENTATAFGGGIYIIGNLAISGGFFGNNTALNGGGIYAENSSSEIRGGEISGNSATSGGGVYVTRSSLLMPSGTVVNNRASYGGGVYAFESDFTLSGGVIANNNAVVDGGGAYLFNGGFTLKSGHIHNNNAAASGGGVFVGQGSITIGGGEISENSATSGAGAFVQNCDSFIMQNGTVRNNESSYLGGGITLDASDFTLFGGSICDNTAKLFGGGVLLSGGSFTMRGGDVTGNKASEYGGGISAHIGLLQLSGGMISGNDALYGGGVFMSKDPGSESIFAMDGGVISGNTASYGAGAYINTDAIFNLAGGYITGNTAELSGGGALASGCSLTVAGSPVIENNKAGGGHADSNLHLSGRNLTVAPDFNGYIGVTTPSLPSVNHPVEFAVPLVPGGLIPTGCFKADKGGDYIIALNANGNGCVAFDESAVTVNCEVAGALSGSGFAGIVRGSVIEFTDNLLRFDGQTITAAAALQTASDVYTFQGWYVNGIRAGEAHAVYGNTVVTAVYKAETRLYRVSVEVSGPGKVNGGSGFTADVPYGAAIGVNGNSLGIAGSTVFAVPDPAPDEGRFVFNGWFDADGAPIISAFTVTDALTILAGFGLGETGCAITFGAENGTLDGGALPDSVDYGTVLTLSPDGTLSFGTTSVTASAADKTGYTPVFEGWKVNGTMYAASGAADAYEVVGTTDVTAVFGYTVKTFTVTIAVDAGFDYGSVSRGSLTDIPYGAAVAVNGNAAAVNGSAIILATPDAAPDGYIYTFAGWFDQGGNQITAAFTLTGALTIYARFESAIINYNVTFGAENGTLDGGAAQYLPHGTQITISYTVLTFGENTVTASPETREGYTYAFKGWKVNGAIKTGGAFIVAADAKITAVYELKIKVFTVTVKIPDDNTYTLQNIPYGAVLETEGGTLIINGLRIVARVAEATEQYTYFFRGWQTEGNTLESGETVTADTVITAVIERADSRISFAVENASEAADTSPEELKALAGTELSADDFKALGEGASIVFKLTVNTVQPSEEAYGKLLASANVLNYKISSVIDLAVSKEISAADNTVHSDAISSLKFNLVLTIPLTAAQQGMRNYAVYRMHGEEIDVITMKPNAYGEYIELSEDGTYIILYLNKLSQITLGCNDTQNKSLNGLFIGLAVTTAAVLGALAYVILRTRRSREEEI